MAKIKIELEEIRQKMIEVEAKNVTEAMLEVSRRYHDRRIKLLYEDVKGITLRKHKEIEDE